MVTAQIAWDLAEQSHGGFQLGLGTQVKAHIVRRFSTEWDRPVARMRDTCSPSVRSSAPSRVKRSSRSRATSIRSSSPISSPAGRWISPRSDQVAGVNKGLARPAGEVCDGFHVHPFHSRVPHRGRPSCSGCRRAEGRTIHPRRSFIAPVFIVVGDTEEERAPLRNAARQQIRSTPARPPTSPSSLITAMVMPGVHPPRLMSAGDMDGRR